MDARSIDIPDDGPRHIRYALQCFEKGYTLYIDVGGGCAMWRHSRRSTLSVALSTAEKIATELPEFSDRIIYANSPEPMTDTETKKVVLDKPHYLASELAELTGYSDTWAHQNRHKLTAEKQGTAATDPWHYFADERMVALLEDRGFAVDLAVQESAPTVHENGESVHDETDSVQASGDGQSGDEPSWDDWRPNDAGFQYLPPVVRDYVTKIRAQRDEAKEARAKSESEIGQFAAENRKLKNENKRISDALEEMHEKYDSLEETIHNLANERLERLEGSTPHSAVKHFAFALDRERESNVKLEKEISRLNGILAERNEHVDDLIDERDELIQENERLQSDIEHAHKKGKADGHYEADQEADGYHITKVIEQSGIHVLHALDGLQRRNVPDPLQRLEKAYANLVLASLDGDDGMIRETRQTFHEVCDQVALRAIRLQRAARRKRFKAFFTRFVRA